MKPFIQNFATLGFGSEIIYSFVIIFCSFMVYFETKELYELSSHKGIKYFRQAFLFFAIAYFFRSFIKFVLVYFDLRGILELSPRIIGSFSLFLFMYFSSMAIFYLLYSVMWKKWGDSKKVYLFHILSALISVISIMTINRFVHLCINLFLFLFVLFIVFISYNQSRNKKKDHNNLFIIYLLLFLFWILNIIDILIPRFLEGYRLLVYLFSIGIFLLILYKVIKKVGSN